MEKPDGPERLHAPWRMEYVTSTSKPKGGCIFCDKPQEDRDRENYIIYRGEHTFMLLNAFPYNSGHLMVVPYQHTAELSDLSPETQLEMMQLATVAVEALQHIMCPEGFNLGINLGRPAGAGIAEHLHLHVVPRWTGDTNFMPVIGNTRVLPESLEKTWEKVTAAVQEVLEEKDQG